MKVDLISYTGQGHPDPLYAAKLLVFTKNTRLQMTPDGMNKFAMMSEEQLKPELDYMAGTIPSSWEFVDLIFSINDVSRATAQQITRTRTASFAMQSQRVTDMRDVTWDKREEDFEEQELYDARMNQAINEYQDAVDNGMTLEDARDLLPIGVHCNLIAKYNLRNFVELCRKRDSLRVQGPYRDMVQQMRAQVLEAWPWSEPFFENPQSKAIRMLEEVAKELGEGGAMYKGHSGKLAKAADLLKV